jgi:AraC family transcriptional activator of pobA
MQQIIPIHDFGKDNKGSVPFRFIPLNAGSEYNTREPHRHNYYEIFFFEKGGGSHTVDFESLPIRAHSIHFVSPGQVHLLQREGALGHIILFSREFYHMAPASRSLAEFPFLNSYLRPVLDLSVQEYAQFAGILQLIGSEAEANNGNAILGHYLQIILLKSLELFKNTAIIHPEKANSIFIRLRELVEQHYREKTE